MQVIGKHSAGAMVIPMTTGLQSEVNTLYDKFEVVDPSASFICFLLPGLFSGSHNSCLNLDEIRGAATFSPITSYLLQEF